MRISMWYPLDKEYIGWNSAERESRMQGLFRISDSCMDFFSSYVLECHMITKMGYLSGLDFEIF